ncbi:hypothetical protein [Labrys sp. KNU-23]|uniref:hypothetical protein n=1 Tax=Labrys sp. KNU-23 TaxID=2789216 RepID=UPI00165ACFCF|nr:hypothetical protein [Labrys sp. KNU-23]
MFGNTDLAPRITVLRSHRRKKWELKHTDSPAKMARWSSAIGCGALPHAHFHPLFSLI